MQKFQYCCSAFALAAVVFSAGCATGPRSRYPDTLAAAQFRTIRIADNIETPSSLFIPSPNRVSESTMRRLPFGFIPHLARRIGGLSIAGRVQSGRARTFTDEVRQTIDFQAFAAETLRASFARAVRTRPEWTLLPPGSPQRSDATFVLSVTKMGVDKPSGFIPITYQPTIIIKATLVGTLPPQAVPVGTVPGAPAILYARTEDISYRGKAKLRSHAATHFAPPKGFSGLPGYSGDVQLFKQAYREAIDLAVQRFAASWN